MIGGEVVRLSENKEEVKMAFQLSNVVPWGRNMAEYRQMFQLNDDDFF